MGKIAFVTPWYGEKISGGAEAELRGIVHHLHYAGVELEILTTCVESFNSNWNLNYHRPGLTIENGIQVRRFKVKRSRKSEFDIVNSKLINGGKISEREEQIFCQEMINSTELYKFIKNNLEQYDLFIFIPYMFGTTFYGCQICPEKSLLIPCLHDESYVYLECFRQTFSKVKGMIFNSEPEQELAKKIFNVQGNLFKTIGIGIDTDWIGDEKRFRDKYKIKEPFILYAGRKEAGKRVDDLIRNFLIYKKYHSGNLKLVLIGGGKVDIPDKQNILDLGFVELQDKYDAYAAATVFCNPSEMESFSLVIMESWLAKTPVLVNGRCSVTRDFVMKSNGGLYYDNYVQFSLCLDYLLENEVLAKQMGKNGFSYVQKNFSWKTITSRYMEYFAEAGLKNERDGTER